MCRNILVSRLPQNTSNINNECTGKPKQLCSLCNQSLGALMSLFYCSDINLCFLLIMPGGNGAIYGCFSSRTTPEVTIFRRSVMLEEHFTVRTRGRVIKGCLKSQIKNQILCIVDYYHFYLPSFINIHRAISFKIFLYK